MIFTDIKTSIRKNLDDLNISFFSGPDIDDSVTDAYNDIVIRSKCILKKAAGLSWIGALSYIDFVADYGITDYLATTAIFNVNLNRFLEDNLAITHFDIIRNDWEICVGEPTNWAPSSAKRIAIFPRQSVSQGTFDLYYWATPPTIADADTPLIASDKQQMFDQYSVADLLEQAEEYTKAMVFWKEYFKNLEEYKDRVQRLAKSDLMLLA
jgi:hypothetical protein